MNPYFVTCTKIHNYSKSKRFKCCGILYSTCSRKKCSQIGIIRPLSHTCTVKIHNFCIVNQVIGHSNPGIENPPENRETQRRSIKKSVLTKQTLRMPKIIRQPVRCSILLATLSTIIPNIKYVLNSLYYSNRNIIIISLK